MRYLIIFCQISMEVVSLKHSPHTEYPLSLNYSFKLGVRRPLEAMSSCFPVIVYVIQMQPLKFSEPQFLHL